MNRLAAFLLTVLSFLTTYGEGKNDVAEPIEGGDIFEDDFDLDDEDAGQGDNEEEEEEGDEEDDEEDDDDDSDDDDSDEEEEEDEDDDDDAESDGDDTDTEGDGGEEEGVDPAVTAALRRNWETRLAGLKARGKPDLLSELRSGNLNVSEDTIERVKQKFKDEDDVGAIREVVLDLVPQLLGIYDEKRISPALTAQQIAQRQQRILSDVAALDAKYPKARTKAVTQRMADLYDAFRTEYGYEAADAVPAEDYFFMAGGKGRKSKGKRTKTDKQEEKKRNATKATRTPEKLGKTRKPGGKRRKKGDDDVAETFSAISRSRREPFVMP